MRSSPELTVSEDGATISLTTDTVHAVTGPRRRHRPPHRRSDHHCRPRHRLLALGGAAGTVARRDAVAQPARVDAWTEATQGPMPVLYGTRGSFALVLRCPRRSRSGPAIPGWPSPEPTHQLGRDGPTWGTSVEHRSTDPRSVPTDFQCLGLHPVRRAGFLARQPGVCAVAHERQAVGHPSAGTALPTRGGRRGDDPQPVAAKHYWIWQAQNQSRCNISDAMQVSVETLAMGVGSRDAKRDCGLCQL